MLMQVADLLALLGLWMSIYACVVVTLMKSAKLNDSAKQFCTASCNSNL